MELNQGMQSEGFEGIDEIIRDPLSFKAQLAIGEDAYLALRAKKYLFEAWDTVGVATSAGAVASSSTIASTFFGSVWTGLGIGTAVTPVGWIAAAAVVSGGAWLGITRLLKKTEADRVVVIPKFINTPLDVLALSIFDMLAPLAVKVACIDGVFNDAERQMIKQYFVKKWGYHPDFVDAGLIYIESGIEDYRIKQQFESLAAFTEKNRDCNYAEMTKEIVFFLKELIEADGKIDEREEFALEKIERFFAEHMSFTRKTSRRFHGVKNSVAQTFGKVRLPKKLFKRNRST